MSDKLIIAFRASKDNKNINYVILISISFQFPLFLCICNIHTCCEKWVTSTFPISIKHFYCFKARTTSQAPLPGSCLHHTKPIVQLKISPRSQSSLKKLLISSRKSKCAALSNYYILNFICFLRLQIIHKR